MPYNLDLEKRLDHFSVQLGNFDKKKMFGGIGYMMNGNMAFGIHKQYLIVRVSPEQGEELLKREFVSLFTMTRKHMAGWLMVSPEGIATDKQLLEWLNISVKHGKTLPPK